MWKKFWTNKKLRITVLAIVIALLLAATAVIILNVIQGRKAGSGPIELPGVTPDYPAPPIEEGAEDMGDNEDKLEAPAGGGAVGMIYSDEVSIDLSDGKVTLLFANPNRSTHNVSIQLVVQDLVLAESGLLPPSKQITSLDVKAGVSIPEGVYANNAKIVVRFYDPETNACSIVNSEIAIAVTVRQ